MAVETAASDLQLTTSIHRRWRQPVTLLHLFMIFTILNYLYAFFYPRPDLNTGVDAPIYVFLFKDALWMGICLWVVSHYLLARSKATRRNRYLWPGYTRTAIFFFVVYYWFLVVSFSHLMHQDPLLLLREDLKNVLLYALLVLLLPHWINSERDIQRFVRLLLFLGVIEGVLGLLNYFYMPDYTLEGRILGTLEHPNHLGFFLSIVLLMIIAKMLVEKRVSWLWYGAILVCLVAMVLANSFGAYVTVICGVCLMILLTRGLAGFILNLPALGITLAVLYVTGLLQIVIDKTFFIFDKYSGSTTISGRVDAIQDMMTYLNQANVFELLFGDYKLALYKTYDSMWWILVRNDGFLIAGLIFILFLAIAMIGFRKYRLFEKQGNLKMASIMLGSATLVLVADLVSFNITAYLSKFPLHFYFYFLCGIILIANPQRSEPVIVQSQTERVSVHSTGTR
jgi:hypothetical protein